MIRVLKIAGIITTVLAGLLLLTFIAIRLVSDEMYKEWIITDVKSSTGRDLTIDGEFDIDIWSKLTIRADDIRFANADWGTQPDMFSARHLKAQIDLISLIKGIADVTLQLDKPDILVETDATGRGNWEMGTPYVESGQENGSDLPFSLLIPDFSVNDLKLTYINGKSGQRAEGDIGNLNIGVAGEQLGINVEGKYNEASFNLSGSLDRIEDLLANRTANIRFDGNAGDVKLGVTGTVGPVTPNFVADVLLELHSDSMASFTPFTGAGLPDLGELDAIVRFSAVDGLYSVSELTIDLKEDATTVSVQGSIGELMELQGLELKVSANTDSLAEMVGIFDLEAPIDLPPTLILEAEVTGGKDKINVEDFQAEIRDKGFEATLTGSVDNALTLKGVKADFTVKAGKVSALSKYVKAELPDLGPLEATGRIISADNTYRIENIKGKLADDDISARFEGSIGDLLNLKNLKASLDMNLKSLSSLSTAVRAELPDIGPLALQANISAEEGLESGIKLSGKVENKGMSVLVETFIHDIHALDSKEMSIDFEAKSLSDIGKLVKRELPDLRPFSISAKVRTQPGKFKADDLVLILGEDKARGSLAFAKPSGEGDVRPVITGSLAIDSLDLTHLLPSSQEKVPEAGDGETGKNPQKLFSSEPFPLGLLRAYNVDAAVTVNSFKWDKLNLSNVEAALVLKDGLLTLQQLKALGPRKGGLEGTVKIDSREQPASFFINLDFEDIPLPRFGGNADFELKTNGKGDSIAALMGGLNGQIILAISGARLEKSFLTKLGRGLFNRINPLAKEKDFTELECVVVRLDISDGMVDFKKKFAAQTTEVTWFGGGEINLKTEELDIGAHPKPRKGLGLSLGEMAKLVHVGGTLANPKIQLDPKGLTKNVAYYYAAVATGGVSFLADRLFSRLKANIDVCAKILEGAELD